MKGRFVVVQNEAKLNQREIEKDCAIFWRREREREREKRRERERERERERDPVSSEDMRNRFAFGTEVGSQT